MDTPSIVAIRQTTTAIGCRVTTYTLAFPNTGGEYTVRARQLTGGQWSTEYVRSAPTIELARTSEEPTAEDVVRAFAEHCAAYDARCRAAGMLWLPG